MRTIPTFNHIKVRKAKTKKHVTPLDMTKLDSLLGDSHYAQYNQAFMVKSLNATQDEQLKFHKYLDEPNGQR